jgi:hypothetical protein
MVNQNPSKRVFPIISNQKFNKYVKELCQLVGLNRQVEIIRNVGNQRRSEFKNLWETIGTHTGRRTFITLSLQKGMRPETIMEITGHVKTDTMYRYNRITPDVTVSETLRSWDNSEMNILVEKMEEMKQTISENLNQSRSSGEQKSKEDTKIDDPNNEIKNSKGKPFRPPDWI